MNNFHRFQNFRQLSNFFSKLRGARSRLYRRRFLQVNTRWKALAEIYTMHSFAPSFNLKISAKIVNIFSRMNKRMSDFSCFVSTFAFFLRIFDEILSGFRDNFQKTVTSVVFQSNLRKEIRNLPKILKSVKIIHYCSLSFICVLSY